VCVCVVCGVCVCVCVCVYWRDALIMYHHIELPSLALRSRYAADKSSLISSAPCSKVALTWEHKNAVSHEFVMHRPALHCLHCAFCFFLKVTDGRVDCRLALGHGRGLVKACAHAKHAIVAVGLCQSQR
jgi:hypothetical protein